MEFFRKNPAAAENLRGPIFEDKVIDFIVELAHVEEQPTTREELMREIDPPAPVAAGAAEQRSEPVEQPDHAADQPAQPVE
jgi:trigger factor